MFHVHWYWFWWKSRNMTKRLLLVVNQIKQTNLVFYELMTSLLWIQLAGLIRRGLDFRTVWYGATMTRFVKNSQYVLKFLIYNFQYHWHSQLVQPQIFVRYDAVSVIRCGRYDIKSFTLTKSYQWAHWICTALTEQIGCVNLILVNEIIIWNATTALFLLFASSANATAALSAD